MLIDDSGDIKVNVKKTSNLNWRPSAVAAAAFIAASACSVGHAAALSEEGSPLSVGLDHRITRDSNIGRVTKSEYDTVNTTGLRLGLDKSYGRQTYKLSARVARSAYVRRSNFDNTGSNVDGSFSTGIASNWLFTAAGNTQETLAPFEENTNSNIRIVRNIKKYKEGRVSLQYGVSGLWAVVGSHSANRLSYSEAAYQANDANQSTNGLKVVYYSTDLLDFGLGARRVETEYPIGRQGLVRSDNNLDLSANWQITGLSNLSAVLTKSQTSYNLAVGKSSGWGGSFNWDYRPQGLLVYNLEVVRSSSADRSRRTRLGPMNVIGDLFNLTDSVSTSAEGRVSLQATSKTKFGASYEVVRFEQDDDLSAAVPGFVGGESSSYYRAFGLSVDYQILRSLGSQCAYTKYSQTRQENAQGLIRPRYTGNSLSCSVNFTLNL